MEAEERDFISDNLSDLLPVIFCHSQFLAELISKRALFDADVQEIEANPTRNKQVTKLLEIMKSREHGFSLLVEALRKTGQSGAVKILEKQSKNALPNDVPKNVPVESRSVQSDQNHSRYQLNFGRNDVNNEVLPALQSDLVSALASRDLYVSVIGELRSLLLLDDAELAPLETFQYRTEDLRMSEMFGIIRRTGSSGITKCLEKLCDMKNLPVVSRRVRCIIAEKFPQSLRERQ